MAHTATEWQTVETGDGSPMRLFIARPEDGGEKPSVIVFQEAFGVNAHIRDVTMRVAALGYVAVAPELFHRTAPRFEGDYEDISKSRPHMDALTNNLLEDDIRAVYSWIKADAQADGRRMAALGFCLGGKAAFIAGAQLPLKAAVSYYGSAIPSLLPIYAARQQTPLLLVWGSRDKHIDAEKRTEVAKALRAENKPFTQVEFSEAGHGFFCEERQTHDADATRESWAMLAMFLKNKL